MNITLDITTNSSVYNPLGAKGQWIQHRFGERNISRELSTEQIENIVSALPTSHITLESVFGDPIDHSEFNEVLKVLRKYNVHATIITYGGNSTALQEAASSDHCSLFIKVCDKVFLGSNITQIIDTCSGRQNNIMLENTVFKHNNNSIIKDICSARNWQYFETPGVLLSGFCSSIIDQTGNWMYDVHGIDSQRESLIKTSEAWHRLKMFVKPVKGKSILDTPKIKPIRKSQQPVIEQNDDLVFTVSGHLIKNREHAAIFANALCDDWDAMLLNADEPYEAKTLAVLKNLCTLDFETINIDNVAVKDIINSYL